MHADHQERVLARFDSLYETVSAARDVEAALRLFASDDDIWFAGSDLDELARGPAQLRALLEQVVEASPPDMRLVWDARDVRVEGSAAWVAATGAVTADVRSLPYRALGILLLRDGERLWHAHHGAVPDTHA